MDLLATSGPLTAVYLWDISDGLPAPHSWTVGIYAHGYGEGNCFIFFSCVELLEKKHQPPTLCSSAIYSNANLWPRWLQGFQGRVSFCLGGLEGEPSSWLPYKVLCTEKTFKGNLENLHHLLCKLFTGLLCQQGSACHHVMLNRAPCWAHLDAKLPLQPVALGCYWLFSEHTECS